jgi:hypothetical protein
MNSTLTLDGFSPAVTTPQPYPPLPSMLRDAGEGDEAAQARQHPVPVNGGAAPGGDDVPARDVSEPMPVRASGAAGKGGALPRPLPGPEARRLRRRTWLGRCTRGLTVVFRRPEKLSCPPGGVLPTVFSGGSALIPADAATAAVLVVRWMAAEHLRVLVAFDAAPVSPDAGTRSSCALTNRASRHSSNRQRDQRARRNQAGNAQSEKPEGLVHRPILAELLRKPPGSTLAPHFPPRNPPGSHATHANSTSPWA